MSACTFSTLHINNLLPEYVERRNPYNLCIPHNLWIARKLLLTSGSNYIIYPCQTNSQCRVRLPCVFLIILLLVLNVLTWRLFVFGKTCISSSQVYYYDYEYLPLCQRSLLWSNEVILSIQFVFELSFFCRRSWAHFLKVPTPWSPPIRDLLVFFDWHIMHRFRPISSTCLFRNLEWLLRRGLQFLNKTIPFN